VLYVSSLSGFSLKYSASQLFTSCVSFAPGSVGEP
jgi:hypothetical protein